MSCLCKKILGKNSASVVQKRYPNIFTHSQRWKGRKNKAGQWAYDGLVLGGNVTLWQRMQSRPPRPRAGWRWLLKPGRCAILVRTSTRGNH